MKAPNTLDDEKKYEGQVYNAVHIELKAKSIKHRRTKIDGVPQIVTRDMNMDRLNIEVEQGIVTKVYRG